MGKRTWLMDTIEKGLDRLEINNHVCLKANESIMLKLPSGFSLNLRDKKYYIESDKYGEDFLCPDTETCRDYLMEIADTYINNKQREERMDSWDKMI